MNARDKFYTSLIRAKAASNGAPLDDATVIRVGEHLNARSAELLKTDFKILIGAGHRNAVIDLVHVTHVDSSGLGALVSALRAVREIGGTVHLVATGARLLHMLEVTALTRVFKLFPCVADAVAALSRQAA